MDKIAANNHFVVLKKEVKKAKAMVCGNLIRKISKHKQEKEKLEDEAQIKKIEDKIASVFEETKLLKTLDSYTIAKQATLKPDQKFWEKVINDSKATAKERLTARVIVKNNIKKQVIKFRTDHKDCDEWFTEYLEYREKKREIIGDQRKSKGIKRSNVRTNPGGKKEGFSKSHQNRKPDDLNVKRRQQPKRDNVHDRESIGDEINDEKTESLHPSWESKRKEKELLKAALSGETQQPKRITFVSQ